MRLGESLTKAALVGAACFGTEPVVAEAALDGKSIQRLVSGRSASWVRHDGRSGTITYFRDGRLTSKLQLFGRPFEVEGTWTVRGDRFCRTIRMDSPATRCQQVIRTGGGTYRFVNEDGTATTATFR